MLSHSEKYVEGVYAVTIRAYIIHIVRFFLIVTAICFHLWWTR